MRDLCINIKSASFVCDDKPYPEYRTKPIININLVKNALRVLSGERPISSIRNESNFNKYINLFLNTFKTESSKYLDWQNKIDQLSSESIIVLPHFYENERGVGPKWEMAFGRKSQHGNNTGCMTADSFFVDRAKGKEFRIALQEVFPDATVLGSLRKMLNEANNNGKNSPLIIKLKEIWSNNLIQSYPNQPLEQLKSLINSLDSYLLGKNIHGSFMKHYAGRTSPGMSTVGAPIAKFVFDAEIHIPIADQESEQIAQRFMECPSVCSFLDGGLAWISSFDFNSRYMLKPWVNIEGFKPSEGYWYPLNK